MKRCAIYTRVSTSMQAEKEYNSCEAQKDRISSFIKSQEDMVGLVLIPYAAVLPTHRRIKA